MNDHILNLSKQAEQAADSAHLDACAEGKPSDWQEVFRNKFAEMIIQQCIDNCEVVANMATLTNEGEMARKTKATADFCATMIKQRFGMTE